MKRETAQELLRLARETETAEALSSRAPSALLVALIPALEAELSTVVTPLADLQWVREQLMRAANNAEGKDLLDVVKELRQVLRQIHVMEQDGGAKGRTGSAGKLDGLIAGTGDDWD